MTSLSNSNTTAFKSNSTNMRSAQAKMVWSFGWEFDWSPTVAGNAHSLRGGQHRAGNDELGHVLDKALAYAG